jgi:hypothetical protein
LTETTFVVLFACFLYFLFVYLESRSKVMLIASAATLACSAYVRPIAYYLPVFVFAVLILWAASRRVLNRRLLVDSCIFLVIAMGLIGVWQVRNSVVAGYSGFSAIADKNIYFYKGAATLAAAQGRSYYDLQREMGYMRDETYFQNHPEQRTWQDGRRFEYMRKEGIRILRDHPLTYAALHAKGMMRALLDPGAIDYLKFFKRYPRSGGMLGEIVDEGLPHTVLRLARERPGIFWTNVLFGLLLLVYLALCATGIIGGRGLLSDAPLLILLCAALYFLTLSGGPNSLGRFRHPIMPMVCILAGYGLFTLRHHRSSPVFFRSRK